MGDPLQLVISGAGVFTFAGEGPEVIEELLTCAPVPVSETIERGRQVAVGRIGLVRNHPFSARYDRFGQLDTFSRYAFVATGHALDDAGLQAPDPALEDTGVIVGTAFGCQEANWQFDQFTLDPEQGLRGASPMAFKGTVDNAPAGWVAVAYRFKGVNATFVSGPGAGAEALLCGAGAIAQGRAPRVVAGGVERLISLQIAALEHDGRPPRPFAAEGSAMVVLERAELAAARGHRARGRLLAAARFPGGPASMARFIGDAGVAISALDAVSLATDHHDTLDELVDDLVVVGCTEQPLDEATGAGQMYAAGAPLSLMLLLHRLHRGGGGTGLLVATGEDGERFGFLVTTGE